MTDFHTDLLSGSDRQPEVFFDADNVPVDLQPDDRVQRLLNDGWELQQAGQPDAARPLFLQAIELADSLSDQPGRARGFAQLASLEEHAGNIAAAQQNNTKAIEIFLAIGDGAGLVQAWRTEGFILLRRGLVDRAVAAFSRSLALALQLDTRLVATTLNQLVPVAHFFILNDRLPDLLPLGAAIHQAVEQVAQSAGGLPEDMADFAEVARTVGGVFIPLAIMATEADLSPEQRRKLAARSVHQAWMVDALTRRRWGLADLVKSTLQTKLDFHETLD